jgi:hypothetical protein
VSSVPNLRVRNSKARPEKSKHSKERKTTLLTPTQNPLPCLETAPHLELALGIGAKPAAEAGRVGGAQLSGERRPKCSWEWEEAGETE